MSGLHKVTASIHMVCRKEELVAKTNVKYQADQDVINFIKQAPGVEIKPEDVTAVIADDLKKLEKEYEGLCLQLQNHQVAMEKDMAEQKEELMEALKRAEKARSAAQEAKGGCISRVATAVMERICTNCFDRVVPIAASSFGERMNSEFGERMMSGGQAVEEATEFIASSFGERMNSEFGERMMSGGQGVEEATEFVEWMISGGQPAEEEATEDS